MSPFAQALSISRLAAAPGRGSPPPCRGEGGSGARQRVSARPRRRARNACRREGGGGFGGTRIGDVPSATGLRVRRGRVPSSSCGWAATRHRGSRVSRRRRSWCARRRGALCARSKSWSERLNISERKSRTRVATKIFFRWRETRSSPCLTSLPAAPHPSQRLRRETART